MTKQQVSGMAGTFLVAAELALMGYIPLLTSRNTKAADIAVFSEETLRNVNIQVKTNGPNTSDSFWLVGKGDSLPKPENFFYVLVKLRAKPSNPDFYVVPSRGIKRSMETDRAKTGSIWYSINKQSIVQFKDRWDLISKTLGSP